MEHRGALLEPGRKSRTKTLGVEKEGITSYRKWVLSIKCMNRVKSLACCHCHSRWVNHLASASGNHSCCSTNESDEAHLMQLLPVIPCRKGGRHKHTHLPSTQPPTLDKRPLLAFRQNSPVHEEHELPYQVNEDWSTVWGSVGLNIVGAFTVSNASLCAFMSI